MMSMRQHFLRLWLTLGIAVLAVSCSGDDSDNTAESALQTEGEGPTRRSIEKENASGETLERRPRVKLATKYKQECTDEEVLSLDCEFMHSLLVAEVAMALGDIERSRDQRGTEQALAALDLTWEPAILIAACRVLGHFPATPGIAEKVTPLLLDSPYLGVAHLAAQLLRENSDPALAAMAQQWSSNHGGLWSANPYQLAPDFPGHYFDMGFPEHPGAEWFGPADSDRSVGWRVAGTPAEVSAWLAEELGADAMSYDQWSQRSSEDMLKAYQVVMDPAYTEEFQKLMEEYMKTQDPAVAEKMQKKQAEMDAVSKKIESDAAKTLLNVLMPPGGTMEDLSYFVAEEKDGHVSRAIMVYRYAGSERTVMQMAWDLRDFPPAWPVVN